jgi:hypothetical protein
VIRENTQTVTLVKAHAILRATYPQITGKTLEILIRNREITLVKTNAILVPMADVQRVLRSWGEQKTLHAQVSPMQEAINHVQSMSTYDLQTTWYALANCNPQEYWDYAGNIRMDDWSELVHGEVDRRHIPHY